MRCCKMHGAGNSFVVLENLRGELDAFDLSRLARSLCDRTRGLDTDGMMVLVPGGAEADFGMLFYNADGSMGEMCGNGLRCAARYGWEHALATDPENIRIRATAGTVRGRRMDRERYQVSLPRASVLDLHRQAQGRDCAYTELGDPGLPHAVLELPPEAFRDLDGLRRLGSALRHDPAFPRGANVSFVCPTGEDSVRALTFERGVEDFTPACGSGSGAIALCLLERGRLRGETVKVSMPGGLLEIGFVPTGEAFPDLLLTGPTALVWTGELDIRDGEFGK